jgi:hypothetical protein
MVVDQFETLPLPLLSIPTHHPRIICGLYHSSHPTTPADVIARSEATKQSLSIAHPTTPKE